MVHHKFSLVYCQSYETVNTLPCLLCYNQSQVRSSSRRNSVKGTSFHRSRNIGEILASFLYRQNYLAAEHRRDFSSFIIQTELLHRWSSARFWLLYHTHRTTSPLIIGEILVPLLYRQNYLAADHRRDFSSFIIQTELPRRWTTARFWFYYTDRITSPLNIGEILVPLLYRQNYFAADHRRDFGSFIIQTELPRRWTSARKRFYISVILFCIWK